MLAIFPLFTSFAQGGYSVIKDADGIKVYLGPSRHIELGAEATIDAPPDVVRQVLLDYANAPLWVKGVAHSTILDRGDHFLDVYQQLSLPVVSDRDYTLHVTWADEGDVKWLRFSAHGDRGPPPGSGRVRVTTNEGSWALSSRDGGKTTHAVYHFELDMGGSVPSWMGRGQAGKQVYQLVEALRRQTRFYK